MTEPDDRTLVREFLDGDRAALERLVDRHQRAVYNIAYRISRDREDARDISQTAFVKALQNLGSYDPRYKFFSWLYRIAINEALRFTDRRKPQREMDPSLAGGGSSGPEEELQRDEECRRVRAAVARLPQLYREVIYLRHFADLSYADLSVALSIPEKTVKSRLFTARRLLRDSLLEIRESM